MYRDDRRSVWFYYEEGKWSMAASLPSHIKVDLGDHVTLEMDTDTPYVHHKSVSENYPPGRNKVKKNGKKGKG